MRSGASIPKVLLIRGRVLRPEDACQKRFSLFFYWIPKVQKCVNRVDLVKSFQTIGIDTAKNMPLKVCQKLEKNRKNIGTRRIRPTKGPPSPSSRLNRFMWISSRSLSRRSAERTWIICRIWMSTYQRRTASGRRAGSCASSTPPSRPRGTTRTSATSARLRRI